MTEGGGFHEQVREREAPAPRRRGHGAKITEAVRALQSEGKLPSALRTSERDNRILTWLRARGFTDCEMPSRHAIARYFDGISVASGLSETSQSHIAERAE